MKGRLIITMTLLAGATAMAADSLVLYRENTGAANAGFVGAKLFDGAGGDMGTYDNLGGWAAGYTFMLGDIDGDGYDNAVLYDKDGINATADVFAQNLVVDTRTGEIGSVLAGSQPPSPGSDDCGTWVNGYVSMLGDLDGDGTDSLILYQTSSGNFYQQDFVSDGAGGLTLGNFDNIGTWSPNYVPLVGDLDNDGTDSLLLYSSAGALYSKEIVNTDGDLSLAAAQDSLGSWGNSTYTPVMGDWGNGTDGADEFFLYEDSTGKLLNTDFVADTSADGGLRMNLVENGATEGTTYHALGTWAGGYEPVIGNITPIPEPGTLGLISSVGVAMLWIRRKLMV